MSPRTKLVILALLIGVVLISLLYLMDVQFGFGYFSLSGLVRIVIIITVILYAVFTIIAQKLRERVSSQTTKHGLPL